MPDLRLNLIRSGETLLADALASKGNPACSISMIDNTVVDAEILARVP